MSYVVLARKYRPRTFAQMVGQEHVVRALGNALTQQRLHHAYLFTGTRGIGKTTVSRILAKSLNCTGVDGQGGITATPCGVCQACTEIDADRYLDYIEMDAASNGGKDEIRDLIERAAYKPGIGRFKVFMIDEAHQLSTAAFNALLKTLEEPPEYLKFVLATTDPEKILPTVLSRCLQFNLRPMASEVVQGHLQQVLATEGVHSDAAALRLLSRAARGSMRDALSLTDQAIAYGGGRIDEAGVRAMLGAVEPGHAAALIDALARRDAVALLARLDSLRTHGLSADGTLESMAVLLQQMAIEQAVPGTLPADDMAQEDTRRLARLMPADETQLLYSIVLQGRGELQAMADDYSALTMVLLRMLAFAPARLASADGAEAPSAGPARAAVAPCATALSKGTPVEPARRSQSPPSVSAQGPVPAHAGLRADMPAHALPGVRPDALPGVQPARQPIVARSPEPPPWLDLPPPEEDSVPATGSAALRAPAPPAIAVPTAAATPAATLVPTPLGERWAELVGRLLQRGSIAALARELAWQAGLTQIDADTQPPTWRLSVERDSLRNDALRDKLCLALIAELGHPLQLVLDNAVPADSPARRDAAGRERRQREAETAIRSDPLVIDLMSQFKGARIVPGSIKPI